MLEIAVCEEYIQEQDSTYNYVAEYIRARPESELMVRYFNSGSQLLNHIQFQGRFDIYLLDIDMPDMNGIEIAKKIRGQDDEAAIIYCSGTSDYAIQSYSVFAYYYLVKPYNKNTLYFILDKLLKKICRDMPKAFMVKVKSGIVRIKLHELIYAESKAHNYYYYLKDGSSVKSSMLRSSFNQVMEPLLRDNRYLKISASYIINMNYARRIECGSFVMDNGEYLTISRNLLAGAKEAYMNFLNGRET